MLSRLTYPRSRRLLKRRDFMRVLKTGKRVSNSQLSFAVLKNDESTPRLGVALAKRFIKLAVKRNMIKRQVRESYRLHPNLPNIDIVVVTRKTTDFADLKGIRNAADELFNQLEKRFK